MGVVEGPRAGMARARQLSAVGRSAIVTGRSESPREATILVGLARNPDCLLEMADLLAEIDWQGHGALRVCQSLLQVVVDGEVTAEAIGEALSRGATAEAYQRLERMVSPGDQQRLAPGADPHAVHETIRQAIVLHRRARTLHSELKAAERALSEDASEDNLAWLIDVKARLLSVEGTQAMLGDDGTG
jgi:DNA primase